jgi:hypothetical protein
MARYLILGAGKFGRLALIRLARQEPGASFVVVDQSPVALAAARALDSPPFEGVESEAISFLGQRLAGNGSWDWLIPMVPVHVAFAWLSRTAPEGSGWQAVAVPESLRHLVPVATRGPQGEWYLSRARHLCPDDCPEPDSICPVSGEARDLPLYRELASLEVPGYQVIVIPSRQLAPGVGGYTPRDLLDVARDLAGMPGPILVATACRCHGVVHGLARRPGGQGV